MGGVEFAQLMIEASVQVPCRLSLSLGQVLNVVASEVCCRGEKLWSTSRTMCTAS
jgi:hypothetical protein